jgi:cell fate regulator YaaT (PSP1 superfamily)
VKRRILGSTVAKAIIHTSGERPATSDELRTGINKRREEEGMKQAPINTSSELYNVVGVRFKRAGKIYYFDPNDLVLSLEQEVIVETARGLECGRVKIGPKKVSQEDITPPLKKVIRVATEKDKEQYLENQDKEVNAFQVCLEKIKQHQLEMKLIDVEYTFDRNKIIFYFTADGRVDFRELVKDLASIFRTRIELRQIGVRDEAKMLGGLGPCGRSMCCATFLGEFDPVSIKMAKEQNLSLNPAKISGICGRLMCCLKYESESYREINNELPGIGGTVQYQGKNAVVVEQNLLKETLILQLSNQERIEVPLGEVDY